jgi:hypothetical protein
MVDNTNLLAATLAITLACTGTAISQQQQEQQQQGGYPDLGAPNPSQLPAPGIYTLCTPGYTLDTTLNECLNPQGEPAPAPYTGNLSPIGAGGSSSSASSSAASSSSTGAVSSGGSGSSGGAGGGSPSGALLTGCELLQENC